VKELSLLSFLAPASSYIKTVVTYLFSGALSLGFAFWIASATLTPAQSQTDAPPPPPESQIPPPPGGAPAEGDAKGAEKKSIVDNRRLQDELSAFTEPFIYDPEGRRDPFLPPSQGVGETGEGPFGPLLPLQRFDLKDLLLIGIIWEVNDPRAMFLDPNKKVHYLGVDDRIGRNNGYIAVIREGEVVVVETVEIRGEQAFTTQILKIAR
jgi:type IV pilus assembly protein PilP